MEFVCRCVKCSAPFKVDSRHIGRKAKCPQCAHVNIVAAPEEAPSPAAPAAAPPSAPAPAALSPNPSPSAARPRFLESPPTDDQMTSPDMADLGVPASGGGGGVVINASPGASPSSIRRPVPPQATAPPPPTGASASSPPAPPPAPGTRFSNAPPVRSPSASAPPPLTPSGSALPAPESVPLEAGPPEEFTLKVPDRSAGKRGGKPARGGKSNGHARKISPLLLVVGAGVGALVVSITVIALVVVFMSDRDPNLARRVGAKSSLIVDLPAEGRRDIKLILNDQARTIPETGPVQLYLEEGTYRLTLQRRGYQQVDHSFTVRGGDTFPFTPTWEPLLPPPVSSGSGGTGLAGTGGTFPGVGGPGPVGPGTTSDGSQTPGFQAGPEGFDGWQQLFEVAQKRALSQKRDIFMVFSGSDWSKQTRIMTSEIFSQPKFRSFAEQRFVLLVIDLPQTEQGINQLADITQNRNLSMQFGIRSVPTILLLDAGGTPYAADGFFGDGLDKYIQHITLLQNKHAQRDVRLAAVDAARTKSPAERISAFEEAVKWLQEEKLTPHYGRILEKWLAQVRQLDPTNALGKQEILFEADWIARLNSALVDRERTKALSVLGELTNWSKSHKFSDANRAVRLHLIAALLLINALNDPDSAAQHVALAGTYEPSEEKLKQDLVGLSNWARRKDQLSSGTGFIVAAEGYILTNHHVIEGPGKTVVRVPTSGGSESVPAETVAYDAQLDIALLKVDPARFHAFQPLTVSADRVRRGTEVAVFGFPLGDDLGKDVRITTGVIHSPADQSEDKRHVLDCRINPGNSGGPVLSRSGRVIGMVTAKTAGGVGLDSYGVAVAAPDLHAFLAKHLPGFLPPSPGEVPDGESPTRLDWEQVDDRVSASVLMVLKVREP